jgi:hypothetical protein
MLKLLARAVARVEKRWAKKITYEFKHPVEHLCTEFLHTHSGNEKFKLTQFPKKKVQTHG